MRTLVASAMRFHLGAIPISPDFVPDASWTPLRAAAPWPAALLALPIGIVAAGILTGLWFLLTPLSNLGHAMSLPAFLLSFAGIVVVHETIHTLVHPMAGRSRRSIVGFGPLVGFYANYDGELSRNRLVAILLMPLLIISIVPLFVSAVAQVASDWVVFVSVFNAFLSCADMLDAGLVLYQIPAHRAVRFHGSKIYSR